MKGRLYMPQVSTRRKPVVCIETREHFDSVLDAELKTGINGTNICRACQGRYKGAGGYSWKYREDSTIRSKYFEGKTFNINIHKTARPHRKALVCNETNEIYLSSVEASLKLGISQRNLSVHLAHKYPRTVGKLTFTYFKEV
jgi:hypothetical protein